MRLRVLSSMMILIICTFWGNVGYCQNQLSGYVIAIEGDKIYLDLTSSQLSKGETLTVVDGTSSIASVEIEETASNYSQAKAVPAFTLSKIKVGMSVKSPSALIETETRQTNPTSQPIENSANSSKVGVYVAPAQVNDVVGVGHFGGYVSDVLMEQLMFCENIRLLDRTVLNQQVDEINLTGDYIDPLSAIERGKIAGAKYVVQVTMQKPDVVNVTTGIPLASIMGAVSMGLNKNIGAQYMSNVEIATLQASVSITARVVDLQTGEILFMASGKGKAKGKSQMSLEYGALGGAKLNNGAEGFKQTVTGQAIQKAFITIGRNLNSFFSGKATSKVMGSATGFGNYSDELKVRGRSLYMGTDKLDDDDVRNLFYENSEIYFNYKSAKNRRNWGNLCVIVGGAASITGIAFMALYQDIMPEYDPTPVILFGSGAIIAGTGIILNVSARNKMKSIAAEYNRKSHYSQCRLDLVVPNTGGLGLRLTF